MTFLLLLIPFLVAVSATCPFQDKYVCLKYDTDIKMAKLQFSLDHVLKQTQKKDGRIVQLEQKNIEIEKKMTAKDQEIKEMIAKDSQIEKDLKTTRDLLDIQMANRWQLTRIDMHLPKMTNLRLNIDQTPTIHDKFPFPFPKRTRAITISLHVYTWSDRATVLLAGTIGQRGNTKGVTQFRQKHASYADASQELFVPWNSDGLQELELKVSESRRDGAEQFFTFKVTGYVTA